MHFCLIVILKNIKNYKEDLEILLEPFQEYMNGEYNDNGKWDWWRVGGRYAGFITETKYSDTHGFNFDDQAENIDINYTTTEKYLELIQNNDENLTYALLNPNGEWFESHINYVLNPKYKQIVCEQLKTFPNCFAVVVDCHV